MYWSQFVGISTSMISWFPIQGISCGGRAQPQGFIWSTGGVIGHWSWAQLWVMVGCRCLRDKIIQIYIYMIKIDYIYSYATSRHPRGIYKHQQTISPHITTYQLVPFRLQPFQSRRARYGGLCELCQHAEDSEGRVHPVPELGSWGAGDGDNLRAGDVIDPTCFHLVALISRGSSNGGCPSHHASFNIFQYYSLVMVGHPWLGMMWGGHHYPHSTWETSIWMNIINESLGVFLSWAAAEL